MSEKTVPIRSVTLPEGFEARTRVAHGGGYATKLVQALLDETARNAKAARIVPVTNGEGEQLDFSNDPTSQFQKRAKSIRGIYLKASEGIHPSEGMRVRLSTGFVLKGMAGTQKIAGEDQTGILLYNARVGPIKAAGGANTAPTAPAANRTQPPKK